MADRTGEFSYDPFSREAMTDPLPIYKVLRDKHPVYYSSAYDAFFLSRFDDIWTFLSGAKDAFAAPEGTVISRDVLVRHNKGPLPDPPLEPFGSHTYFGSPVYEQVRKAHGKPLLPRAVRSLEEFVRSVSRERLDELLPRRRFDLTRDYGGPVAAATICHLTGIPLDAAPRVLTTVNRSTQTVEGHGIVSDEVPTEDLRGFVEPVVAGRRAEGHDGTQPLIDGMLDFRLEGRPLTDSEIADNLLCVLVGGTETLPKVVAHGIMELWRHPDQLTEVRSDPAANVPLAFNEINRFCGPAQWFGRTARKRVTVAGQIIEPGQRVIYLLQSASRDEREFPEPDEFRWDRKIRRELSFGHGLKFCIGAHLARLEGRVLLEEFLGRVTDFDVDIEAAVRPPSSFQWGWTKVPVVIRQFR